MSDLAMIRRKNFLPRLHHLYHPSCRNHFQQLRQVRHRESFKATDCPWPDACPATPVNTSATWKGWDRNFWILYGIRFASDQGKFINTQNSNDILQSLGLSTSWTRATWKCSSPTISGAKALETEKVDRPRDIYEFCNWAFKNNRESKWANVFAKLGQLSHQLEHTLLGMVIDPFGRNNAFLKFVPPIEWLITNSRWRSAQKSGYFRTCLRKTEDIIHEKKNILSHFIPKIFGHRKSWKSYSHTSSRRLVHLTVYKSNFGLWNIILVYNTRFWHFLIEVITFTRALPYPGKNE